jgi:Amt family ammonium transporter
MAEAKKGAPLTTFEKAVVAIACGTFIACAGLTAGLPINQPSNQPDATAMAQVLLNSTISGNNAFIMVCSFLAFLLVPGFALLHGSLRGVNSTDLAFKTMLTASVVAMFWVVIMFSAVWASTTGNNGVLGIAKTYYMFHDVDYYHFIDLAPYTSNIAFAIFECAFPIVTLAIALAGVIDRVNLMVWLFFAGFWHCVVWCPTAHVIWNSGGALYKNFIMDFAGGVVVHIQAAIVVLAFKLVLDRNNKKVDEVPAAARETTSATIAMSLTIVFFATFGFIAGKGHDSGPDAVQAVANTIAAGVAGMLMWFFLDTLAEKEATIVSISQGLLLGLISATPSAGYVTIGGSFCIAIGTVLLTWVGAFFTNERRCQNCSLSIMTLHGVGGILGFFFTSLFSYKMVNSAAYNGVMYGRGIPVAYHLAALCIFVPCIFLATALVVFVSDLIVPLKNRALEESTMVASPVPTTEPKSEPEPAAIESGNVELSGVPAEMA